MRLVGAVVLIVWGIVLVTVGVTAPGAWAGTFAGLVLVAIGYLVLDGWLIDRRERRRRERRPGYITDRRDS